MNEVVSYGEPCTICGDEGHHVDHAARSTFACCSHCPPDHIDLVHLTPCVLCAQGQPNGDDQ